MSIRLNKALRELNIGLQTAVEFLEKKSELGEVKAEPSFKLSDEQYAALTGAFQHDKEVRTQAEKLLQKKPKEKKANEDEQNDKPLSSTAKQQYKPLGKIDLDSIGKKHSEHKPAKPEPRRDNQAKTAAVSQKLANKNNTPQKPAAADVKVDKKTENKQNKKPVVQNKEHKQEKKKESKTTAVAQPAAAKTAEAAKEQPAEASKSETTLFTTKSEKKMLNTPKVNVLGKIDLSTRSHVPCQVTTR